MAERLMKKVIKEKKLEGLKISSRGLNATGENIADNAKFALKTYHASSANRKSVKLGKIDKNTLYVTMTESQKNYIGSDKVISFKSLIGEDIPDPYGQDKEAYLACAKELLKGVKVLIEKIKLWRWKNDNISKWPCGLFTKRGT